MEERAKNRVILTLVISMVFFLVSALNSCNNSRTQRRIAQREMADRLQAEEGLDKLIKEKSALEDEVGNIKKKLDEQSQLYSKTEETIARLQIENEKLKLDLDKMTKLKEALENDLKDALISDARSRR